MKGEVFKVNSYYEGLIQNIYAGQKGCFVSFMQFFYQFNQSVVFSPNISDCFEKLYKLELENCKILSELILRMDGDNKFYSSSRKFISGYNVDYIKNFSKIFLADIELLEVGIIEVKNIISKIDNVALREKLKIVLENKKNALKMLKENYFKNNLIN